VLESPPEVKRNIFNADGLSQRYTGVMNLRWHQSEIVDGNEQIKKSPTRNEKK